MKDVWWSLCGFKACAKSTKPIKFKLSQNQCFRPEIVCIRKIILKEYYKQTTIFAKNSQFSKFVV